MSLYNAAGSLLLYNGASNTAEFKANGNIIAVGGIGLGGVEAVGNYKLDVNGWAKFRGPLEIQRLTAEPSIPADSSIFFVAGNNTTQVRFGFGYRVGTGASVYKWVNMDSGAIWESGTFAQLLT